MQNEIPNGCKKRGGFSSLFPWIFKVFSVWFSLRFSTLRFRIRAAVAKCGMPEYYGFYNGFWRFSSFTFFLKMVKKHEISSRILSKKSRKFSAEFPWKFDAKKHENSWKSMKINTRKPTFEKRGSEVRFLIDLGYFWGSVGGPKWPQVGKKGVQEGTQKTMKKRGSGISSKTSWKGNVSI